MNKDGYYGDFDSLADEQRAYDEYMEQEEPNVVPCFKCGSPMYEEGLLPKDNICDNCKK